MYLNKIPRSELKEVEHWREGGRYFAKVEDVLPQLDMIFSKAGLLTNEYLYNAVLFYSGEDDIGMAVSKYAEDKGFAS